MKSRETVTCDGAFGEHLQEPDFVSMTSFRPFGSGLRLLPHSLEDVRWRMNPDSHPTAVGRPQTS